jgi:plasmid maintenance system antidote protein VapI
MKSKRAAVITEFGRPGVIFEEEDVVRLLRVEIQKDGSQAAWARRRGIERANVNAMLSGRIPVSKTVADALGLRRTYTAR